jgi:phage tail-like protein
MSTADRADPYLGFRFRVELEALIVAGFAEVSGLAVELETEPYEEGGVNEFTHTLPTRLGHSNVTLRHGVTDSEELWEWMDAARHGTVERKWGRIILLDATGADARGWEFREGFPVRWEGPQLTADGRAVAIETLEIAHHGLDRYDV